VPTWVTPKPYRMVACTHSLMAWARERSSRQTVRSLRAALRSAPSGRVSADARRYAGATRDEGSR
jgi:hypothetical protein